MYPNAGSWWLTSSWNAMNWQCLYIKKWSPCFSGVMVPVSGPWECYQAVMFLLGPIRATTPFLPSFISSPSHKHVQLRYCQVSDPGYGGLTLELLCIRHCNSCSHQPWAWQMQNHDLSIFLPLWGRASGTPGMSCRLRACTRAVTTMQPTRADMLSHRNLVEAELFISLYYKDKMLPPLKAVEKLWLALQQPTSRPSGRCPWSWKARMWMVPFTAHLL